jgi:glutamine synthetase
VLKSFVQEQFVLGRIQPSGGSGRMGEGNEHNAVTFKPPTDELGKWGFGEIPLDRQPADEQDRARSHECELRLEPGSTKEDLSLRWASVAATTGHTARKTLGDRGHVDLGSKVILLDSNGAHPTEQLFASPAMERTADFEFGDAGSLTDEHDAIRASSPHDGRRLCDEACVFAEATSQNLLVKRLDRVHGREFYHPEVAIIGYFTCLQTRCRMPELTPESVLRQTKEENVRFVNLQFTDITGAVKSVTIPIHQFADSIEHGTWFDGSSIEGFARIAESDMFLKPDVSTFRIVPWERGENTTARVICQVFTPDGEEFPGDPREILLRALREAQAMGYDYYTGPELEFFLLVPGADGRDRPLPHDHGGYFDLSTDLASTVRKEMVNALQDLGIDVEAAHHEVAIGQHEIDFRYGHALPTADNAVTFKYTLKAIAQQHDLHATFMPKPIFGVNGSGMHVHQSLFRAGTDENAFIDPSDEYGLSAVARHFIAGQLAHARGMSAVLASLVNSYKRLVPGYEAPVYISWARVNRSALIRVPRITPAKPKSARIELRFPDPSANPYLAFAVMLAAGLDGIRRELPLSPPIEENLYHFNEERLLQSGIRTLPGSLIEAVEELESDEVIRRALGDHIFERFVEAKREEWNEYRMQVTPWELERYLPVV